MLVSRCPRFAKRVLGVLGISLALVLAETTPAQAGEFFTMAEKEYAFWCRNPQFLRAGGKWPNFGIEFQAYCAVFERYPGQFWEPKEWMSLLVRGSYTYAGKPGETGPAAEQIFRFEAAGVLDPVTKTVKTTEKLVVDVRMQCAKNPWVSGAPCAATKIVNNTGVDVSGPKPESAMALDHNLRKALAEWESRKGQVAELDLLSGIAPIVVPGPGQVFATKDGWIQLGPPPKNGVGLYELEWESALLHAGKMYFRPQPGILDKLPAGQGHRVTFPQEGRWRVRAVNPTWWTRGEWREFWVGATRERALVEYGKEFTRRFQVRRASPAPSRMTVPVVPPPPRAR